MNQNCYSTHCWNRVWECEYQEYILTFLLNCPTAKLPIPYFPIPDDAIDACSCDMGKIYEAITDSISQGATCMKNVNDMDGGFERLGACGCCEISGAMSRYVCSLSQTHPHMPFTPFLQLLTIKFSIFEICPDTNPDLVGMSSVSKIETQLDINFQEYQPMTKINCASDLSFSLPGVSTYYPPSDLPTTGTATLSNKPGSVTTPPSGSVFSYTNGGDSVVYIITAASVSKGGESGSQDSGSTTAATTSKKSTVGSIKVQKVYAVLMIAVVVAISL